MEKFFWVKDAVKVNTYSANCVYMYIPYVLVCFGIYKFNTIVYRCALSECDA